MRGLERATTAVKVGVFAVVMVTAGLLIYRFVTKSGPGGKGYVVYALMNDAAGIAKHSQVRMAGIPVGSIHSIKLEGNKARIDIRMDPEVPLYDDATVTKVASSLLGEYYLGLAAGTEGKKKLEEGDLTLEQSLALYERGVQLSRFCHARLEDAERRIEILTERGDLRPAPATLTGEDADR